jgi:hypothetical protein
MPGHVRNVLMALYRRRLFWRLCRRLRRPSGGEAAMIDKHTALEAISATLPMPYGPPSDRQ